jgi:hypothetical protein
LNLQISIIFFSLNLFQFLPAHSLPSEPGGDWLRLLDHVFTFRPRFLACLGAASVLLRRREWMRARCAADAAAMARAGGGPGVAALLRVAHDLRAELAAGTIDLGQALGIDATCALGDVVPHAARPLPADGSLPVFGDFPHAAIGVARASAKLHREREAQIVAEALRRGEIQRRQSAVRMAVERAAVRREPEAAMEARLQYLTGTGAGAGAARTPPPHRVEMMGGADTRPRDEALLRELEDQRRQLLAAELGVRAGTRGFPRGASGSPSAGTFPYTDDRSPSPSTLRLASRAMSPHSPWYLAPEAEPFVE